MKEKVNNWDAANELERFQQKHILLLRERIAKADAILKDEKFVWKEGQKEKAVRTYGILQADLLDFTRLYDAMYKLIQQHEGITNMLSEIYMEWYNDISRNGEQPKEIMSIQARKMEGIFDRIKKAFSEVRDLKLPKTIKNEE